MQTILFQFESQYGLFSDALHFTDEEFAALSSEDIELMKQKRFDNWLSLFNQPEVPVEENTIIQE